MGRGRVGVGVALALTAVLTGCGGGGGQDDGSGEGTEPSSTTRTPSAAGTTDAGAPPGTERPSASAPTATVGSAPADDTDTSTDAEACFDGRCEIAVSGPTTIRIDPELGVSDLRITKVTDDVVVLQSSGAGTFLSSSVGEDATGGLNGLGFRVKSLDGGTAVLEFFPRA